MQHDTVIRLSKVKNIIGIKEATGDMQRAKKLVEEVPQDFLLLSGDDATAKDFMLLGGHGVISVTANVVPTEFAELCKLAIAGQDQAAKAVDDRLQPLNKVLFLESNPIPVKWALQRMGLIPEGIRLPLTPLAERYHDPIRAVMRELELL
jgi:dihydrodipicolinate synthase/N-acetylneuraminate lyase